jgi:hypothetical protein
MFAREGPAVYGDIVGMVQSDCGSCASAAAFIASDLGRQDFQCNITVQSGIASAVYSSMPPLPRGTRIR